MNVTIHKAKPKDPSFNQVRIRNQKPTHQYVIPSTNFATIPNNHVQSRIMRNAHNRRRISLPPSIREEEDDKDEEDEEDIPLAILAYRKGFITPDSLPLVQDLQHKRFSSDPCFQMTQNYQFYQLNNSSFSSSSSSSLSSNELATKRHVPATEPKFYRRYSSGK
ncbi:hypothetical protein HPULCUR_004041 [Helicostylum pulchrum]|uniref:Uncharacterized protein n=1 Tax=Helicostylum pulchrum TaxID=562976 RepID=A0ABP9XV30_9FUNG